MPVTSTLGGIQYYEIAVRQIQKQILPPGLPSTTLWGYGSKNHPWTFNYPACTIEARVDVPLRVKWINDLKDAEGHYLPHLLPVDQTLHWANPSQQQCMDGAFGTDCRTPNPAPYTGPVPLITHVHGAHVSPESDGYPEAWYLPAANNIPAGYATHGSKFGQVAGVPYEAGAAVFQYRNDQRATTLWFHDHTLGMTRTNVYAGPVGFYLLRGGTSDLPSEPLAHGLPGPAPKAGDRPGKRYYEIPIVIQDRSFNADGSLFYAPSRRFFDGYPGPYVGDRTNRSDISPIWNPEFFGNTMVVNGNTWPYLNVEPRKYRFRFLDASNSRFLILKFDQPGLKFTQIGTDGGFLPRKVELKQLLLGPAERADVVVDFSDLAPGSVITLLNVGPDSPFGGLPIPADLLADPSTTGQVMQFRVVPLSSRDASSVDRLPALAPISLLTATTRKVSLNELDSAEVCVDPDMGYVPGVAPPSCNAASVPLGPLAAQLGTIDGATGMRTPLPWMAPITENPALGATEIWEIHNFTEDAHPIHLHLVMFQVMDRTPMGAVPGGPHSRPPERWEHGFKDTVIAYPAEVTRIKAVYDIPGLFVWHCHILEHEDNEMMRPYFVGGGVPGLVGRYPVNAEALGSFQRPVRTFIRIASPGTKQ
jgi:FtsP/CotA-like multicopper oxidase with cupredoxin domain